MYHDWSPERQRTHRIYRAFHELLAHPRYRLVVSRKTLATEIEVVSERDTDEAMTPEAEKFRRLYRKELIEHHEWLEGDGNAK